MFLPTLCPKPTVFSKRQRRRQTWQDLLQCLCFKVKLGSGRSHLNTRNNAALEVVKVEQWKGDRRVREVLGSKAEKPNLTSSFRFRNPDQIAAPDLIRMTDGCLVSCVMHENSPSRRPHLGKRWFAKPLRHAVSQQSSDNPFLSSHSLWVSSCLPSISYESKADQTLVTYHDICYSTGPYGPWHHSKSQLGEPWLYLYILELHPGCGNPFLLDTRAWKARPSGLHILIKFVSSHACVCTPSVENPVALGLTSGSHRHRASFDFYLLLTLIYCHPGAQITFFKFFLTWGGWGRGVALMLAWALDCGADQISISNLGGGLWVTTPSHLNVSLRHSLLCAC